MPPTTLEVRPALEPRIQAVVGWTGDSAHAFMPHAHVRARTAGKRTAVPKAKHWRR